MEALRPEDPRSLGPYRLRGRLGEGGMGEVFLGVSPSGLRAAVKTVRPEYAHDPGFRDRFRREVAAARRVDSAWTAPIAEADPDSEPPWLATEYLSGIPLSEAVAVYGPLPERAVRVLAAQLVEALMAIHRADLVHRDLKPSNVILGRDRPRVIDFGISRAMDFATHALTSPGGAIGSPGYMSPEQASGDEVDQRTDIFALGGVLVYAAAGHSPFGTTPQNAMQLMYQIIQGEPRLDDVPEGLRALLADCLAKDPEARPSLADILHRTVGDEDLADSSGGAWLPPALVAELIRRQNTDPTAALAEAPTAISAGPIAHGVDGDELPGTRAHNGANGATDVLAPPAAPGTTPLSALPPPRPPAHPTAQMTSVIGPGPAANGATAGAGRGPSRRGLLIGGAALGVAAAGGVAGWLLTRDSEPGTGVAWSLAVGAGTSARCVAYQDTLFVATKGAEENDAPDSAALSAVDRSTGELLWRNATAGPGISRPVATKDRVFVHSWVETEDSSAPSKYHTTLYAFDMKGDVRWTAEFDALSVRIPETAGDVLVVAVSPPTESSSDAGEGRVIGYDAATGAERWTYPLPADTPVPNVPCVTGDLAVVSAGPDSSSDPGAVYAVKLQSGALAWQWQTGDDGPFVKSATAANGRVFVRATANQPEEYYAKERALTALSLTELESDRPKVLWRTPNLPAGDDHETVVDAATDTVFTLTEGTEPQYGTKTEAWVKAYDGVRGALKWQFKPKGLHLSQVAFDKTNAYFAAWPSDAQAGVVKPSATPSPTAPPTSDPITTGYVYAVNIVTGTLLWTVKTGGIGAVTTPQVAKGVVCVGLSQGPDDAGWAIGIDIRTGEETWRERLQGQDVSGPLVVGDRFHLVSAPDEDAREKSGQVGATAYEFRP